MGYYAQQTNSNGGVAMFKVLVFIGAGFLACALVWSLNQNYQIRNEAAAAKTSSEKQIAQITQERDQAIQAAVDQHNTLEQANSDRDAAVRDAAAAKKELAAEKVKTTDLSQQVDTLKQTLANSAQPLLIPATGACPPAQAVPQPKFVASGLIDSADFPVPLLLVALATWLLVAFGVIIRLMRRRRLVSQPVKK
jgi:hypothetical protein